MRRALGAAKTYLAVCAIYRDEAPYLREWLEFHRLVGVERFFLYDDGSRDFHHELLAPYIEEGVVVLREWATSPHAGETSARAAQFRAYDHCLKEHRDDSRWIAFIDADEFLFSPSIEPVSKVLAGYERWPAVGVNCAVFGTSGHRTKPSGLVIESYLHRTNSHEDNRYIKSIVDPTRTLGCISAHAFDHGDGLAVGENHERITGPPFGLTESVSFSRLRINHYYTRSEEEWYGKLPWQDRIAKERGIGVTVRQRIEEGPGAFQSMFNEQRDEAITAYLPALRDALEMLSSPS